MNNIAIITARGGSKRIPKKNIKLFCGKPIIAYSIEAALDSDIFSEVMVSTDDEEIRDIAIKYGAKVPFMRTEETSNDYVMTHDVLLEVIQMYNDLGVTFDNMCCIYPTAPFITSNKLKESMNLLYSVDVNAVIPVVQYSFPPQRALRIKNNNLEFVCPENKFVRSQDLPPIYHDCGQFYCVSVNSFLTERQLIMSKSVPYVLDELEVQDIDNETDWKLAELKYKLMSGN